MSFFFIVFFTVYGLVHFYAFLKAKAALHFGTQTSVPAAAFLVLMTFAPVIIRYLERWEYEFLARLMSYIGYVWLGILFLFFASSLFIDIYRLMIWLAGSLLRKDFAFISLNARYAFFIPLAFALAAGTYGYFEAGNIHVEHLTVRSPKIPAEMNPLKIVQISDVHVGLIVRAGRLKKIIEKVEKERPDILVCTGDLVDGQINKLEGLAELLAEIKPEYGKYAVTGNHEYYAGIDQALEFTEKAGFKILRGEAYDAAGITIAGVDDETGERFGMFTGTPEEELLKGLDRDRFILFLKHRPLPGENSPGLFDLQLSGHTHKGQIFPFNLVTRMYYPKHAGRMMLSGGSELYVSRGSGTWGPPVRFLSPPEVTVIELLHVNGKKGAIDIAPGNEQ